MSVPELIIGGNAYRYWQNLTLSRSLERVESELQAQTVDIWIDNEIAIPISDGDTVELRDDGATLFAGFVDDVSVTFDDSRVNVGLVCSSWTADLVDCTAVGGKVWNDTKAGKICADLAEDFLAGVTVDGDEGEPFPRFKAERDEPVIGALRRIAQARGLMMYTDAFGNLILGKPSTERVDAKISAAREGGRTLTNVLTGQVRGRTRDRFSEYSVTSQNSNRSNFTGEQASGALYTATDETITRYRPLLVRARTQASGESLERFGNWERNTRIGRAKRYVYEIEGWTYADGKHWQPNLLVPVDDELLDVQDDLLVASATLSVGESGKRTSLELLPPSAFETEPPKPLNKRRRRR